MSDLRMQWSRAFSLVSEVALRGLSENVISSIIPTSPVLIHTFSSLTPSSSRGRRSTAKQHNRVFVFFVFPVLLQTSSPRILKVVALYMRSCALISTEQQILYVCFSCHDELWRFGHPLSLEELAGNPRSLH